MHIALVVDPERLLTDAAAVQRLAVALAGDGVRIRRILPPARDEPPRLRMIAASTFDFDSSLFFRPSRLGALSSSLEDDPPEIFVSFGARAFIAAAELADDMDVSDPMGGSRSSHFLKYISPMRLSRVLYPRTWNCVVIISEMAITYLSGFSAMSHTSFGFHVEYMNLKSSFDISLISFEFNCSSFPVLLSAPDNLEAIAPILLCNNSFRWHNTAFFCPLLSCLINALPAF